MRAFGFSKPHPREVVSGDAWLVLELEQALRVALIDGAGHGEAAAEAATAAIDSLKASGDDPLPAALARCHKQLHGSRGAAVSVAEISAGSVLFAGVGNVEGRLITPSREQRLSPQRGIAGVVMPTIRPETVEVSSPEWSFILYSDGISHRFRASWESLTSSPGEFVMKAVEQWGRLTDDATVVLVLST